MLNEEKLRRLNAIDAAIAAANTKFDQANKLLRVLQAERKALLGIEDSVVWTLDAADRPAHRFGI